jgi:hypothetical protein
LKNQAPLVPFDWEAHPIGEARLTKQDQLAQTLQLMKYLIDSEPRI